jgi:hypothetical protein
MTAIIMGFFNFLKWRAAGKQADQARVTDSSASEPIRIGKSLESESPKESKNADLASKALVLWDFEF